MQATHGADDRFDCLPQVSGRPGDPAVCTTPCPCQMPVNLGAHGRDLRQHGITATTGVGGDRFCFILDNGKRRAQTVRQLPGFTAATTDKIVGFLQ